MSPGHDYGVVPSKRNTQFSTISREPSMVLPSVSYIKCLFICNYYFYQSSLFKKKQMFV